uniref:REPA_OB_2 domain-containing protein n=1 Tax=Strongyloides papillosus TaxID=174720 RepID=A0A0N5B322_STREA
MDTKQINIKLVTRNGNNDQLPFFSLTDLKTSIEIHSNVLEKDICKVILDKYGLECLHHETEAYIDAEDSQIINYANFFQDQQVNVDKLYYLLGSSLTIVVHAHGELTDFFEMGGRSQHLSPDQNSTTAIRSLNIRLGLSYNIKGTNSSVKLADRRLNDTQHPYEIKTIGDTEIRLVETTRTSPQRKLVFTILSNIKRNVNKCVNVVAIIKNIEKATNYITRNGSLTRRRYVYIMDKSVSSVKVTVFGDFCNNFTSDLIGKAVLLKIFRVNQFGALFTITCTMDSEIVLSGKSKLRQLQIWYNNYRNNRANLTNEHELIIID